MVHSVLSPFLFSITFPLQAQISSDLQILPTIDCLPYPLDWLHTPSLTICDFVLIVIFTYYSCSQITTTISVFCFSISALFLFNFVVIWCRLSMLNTYLHCLLDCVLFSFKLSHRHIMAALLQLFTVCHLHVKVKVLGYGQLLALDESLTVMLAVSWYFITATSILYCWAN